MKEVAIYKQGKLRTYYTFNSTFKKTNISKSDKKFTCAYYVFCFRILKNYARTLNI